MLSDNDLDVIKEAEVIKNSDIIKDKDAEVIEAIGSLTEREREIMNLVSQGFTNAKIADKLCVSMHTAKNHKENIKSKLGIVSCPDLLQFAIKYSTYWQPKVEKNEPQKTE
jgi:DNA-binding CsgD family transcriptional regulator